MSDWVVIVTFCMAVLMPNAKAVDAGTVWPEGMSFVALQQGQWQLFIVPPGSGRPLSVALASEPRMPAYSPELGLVVYISDTGDVVQYDLKAREETALLKKNADSAYAQLSFVPGSNKLLLVELLQGKSRNTRILSMDLETGTVVTISHQRTAQFDPVIHDHRLFYTNVHCVENCAGRYVHEIWVKDLRSGDARQLTLLDAFSHQPALSPDGHWLYLTSERSGVRQIWRCRLDDAIPPLPCNQATDAGRSNHSPALSSDGKLFFLGVDDSGETRITVLKGEEMYLPLPPNVTEVRDLKIGRK